MDNQEKSEPYLRFAKSEQPDQELLTENFTLSSLLGAPIARIPEGYYLLLGDNRSFATDSRYYGLIEAKEIVGVVNLRLLPIHKLQSF